MLFRAGTVLSFVGALTMSLPAYAEGPTATFYNYSNKSLFPSAIVSNRHGRLERRSGRGRQEGRGRPEVEEGTFRSTGTRTVGSVSTCRTFRKKRR